MAKFTLEDLKAATDRRFAPTVVENGTVQYVLQNFVQLPFKVREKVQGLISLADDATDEDYLVAYREVLRLVVQDDRGEELVELLGENAGMVAELIDAWRTGTELGEA